MSAFNKAFDFSFPVDRTLRPYSVPPEFLLEPELLIPERKPTGPVEIDLEHPLRGLSEYIFPEKKLDLIRDTVINSSDTGSPVFKANGLHCPDGSWRDLELGRDWSAASFTIFFICKINSIPDWGGVFSKISTDTTSQLAFGQHGDSGDFYIGINNSSSAFSTMSIDTGEYHKYVLMWRDDNNQATLYKDSFNNSGQVTHSSSMPSGTGVLRLGSARDASDTYDSDVEFKLLGYVKGRLWNKSEIIRFFKDPYQLLKPKGAPTREPVKLEYTQEAYNLPDPRFEMPDLLIPGRKPTGPVEIDLTHPLAKNLRVLKIFNSNTDLVSNTIQDFGIAAGLTVTDRGKAYKGSGNNNDNNSYCNLPILDYSNITGMTVIAFVKWPVDASNYQGIVMSVPTGQDRGNIKLVTEASNTAGFRAGTGGSNATITGLTAGDYVGLIGTWDNISALQKTYRAEEKGGVVEISSLANTGTFTGIAAENYIGYYSRDGGRSFVENIHSVFIYDRALSLSELRTINKNPYQFLIPK